MQISKDMFRSALSLLSSDLSIDSVSENSTPPHNDAQNSIVIDVVAIRLSPLDMENEDSMLQLPRFGYQLYLSGLFVHALSSWMLVVWIPASTKEAFIEKLSKRFEVLPISVCQSIHWLKSALTRALTLHNNSVALLDCGVLFDGYVIKLDLASPIESSSSAESHVTIGIQLRQGEWRTCRWNDLESELMDTVYIAPSLSAILPSYIEEESTQDEDSEQWYLDACLRWGYRLCETLLKLVYTSNTGDVVISRVFPQMLLKKTVLTRPAQSSQLCEDISSSNTAIQLLEACTERWRHFSIDLLDIINANKCLLPSRANRPLFKFIKVGPNSLSEKALGTLSAPDIKAPKYRSPETSFVASDKSSLERYEKVIKVLTAQSSLCPKMRNLLDEIRRDLEHNDTFTPETVKMKQTKANKRQISSKLAEKLSSPDVPRKACRRGTKKPKKSRESSATPAIADIQKKSGRRVHFNTTVLFVDEWDKVHHIKLQQHEATSRHQENDIQQDIESEFTTSLLSTHSQ